MTKPTLPESILSQSFGMTESQVTTVEVLGALIDRAKLAGSVAATAWCDEDGCPHLEAVFMPEMIEEEG